MEPELISASGREVAACLSGDAVGVDLLMRSGCTWRTIVSVLQAVECGVWRGAPCQGVVVSHTVVSMVLRRQTGDGLVVECALVLGEKQAARRTVK